MLTEKLCMQLNIENHPISMRKLINPMHKTLNRNKTEGSKQQNKTIWANSGSENIESQDSENKLKLGYNVWLFKK